MACAVCTYALNAVDDDGRITYQHPVTPDEGHEPVPVPADQLSEVFRRCHFCSVAEPVWMYRTPLIEAESVGETRTVTQAYSTQWNACYPCAQLIDADDSDALTRQSIAVMGWHPANPKARLLSFIHRTIVITREPGRSLLTTSRWSPAQLKAATLPKVRDRLSSLLRGPTGLPQPLHSAELRGLLADGLDQGRMSWIDPQFTALVAEVRADLPNTAITDRIVPTGSGLIAWPTPVDQHHQIAAASWIPSQGGWQMVCYRSVGTDFPDHMMEAVRHEIGWLIPIHVAHIAPDAIVNGDDPLATLVASWLIIAQQLTQDEPVPIDPPIRKAYARARRQPPEVRLIRIKPGRSDPQPAKAAGDRTPSGRAKPDHRYWVSAHERNQAYGPGRSLRQKIDIDPFLKGPQDKPIKASTTVRILGSARARRAENENQPAADS
jgi:hypothetical protein